jgi:hypothetical protein
MQDIEILLRGFALLVDGKHYNPSMTKFLNKFSKEAKSFTKEQIGFFESLFIAFIEAAKGLTRQHFVGGSGRFSAPVFEAVFVAATDKAFQRGDVDVPSLDPNLVGQLRADEQFVRMSQQATTNKANVAGRISRARQILGR